MSAVMKKALAPRTGKALIEPDVQPAVEVPEALANAVRNALLNGDTHYTSRPGIPELRQAIAEALSRAGAPKRTAEEIVICSGASEALFVVLLALQLEPGDRVSVLGEQGEAKALASLFDIEVSANDAAGDIYCVGAEMARGAKAPESATIVGHLDHLSGMTPFRVGYVSAPPSLIAKVRRFKQALSICTAAPSQRAALAALGGSD